MNILKWILLSLLAIIVLYILFLFILSLFVDEKKQYMKNNKLYRGTINFLTGIILFFANSNTFVYGKELLPENERFLLICNHRSNFDPLITWNKLKKYDLAFISKPENLKIPLVGKISRRCCFMDIDRENPRNAVKTINQSVELIKSNEVSVAVYPEGTRSKTGELLPFHNVVFKIALKANCGIAVATIINTDKIHKNAPFKVTDVELKIHQFYTYDEIKDRKTAEIGEEIRKKMNNYIQHHPLSKI